MTAKLNSDYNLAVLFPDIASEWHPTLNGALTPQQVLPKSNKKHYWLCDAGHTWSAAVSSRHVAGCPVCYKLSRQVAGEKTLRDYPNLLSELAHLAQEDPHKDLYVGSTKSLYWRCTECSELWRNQIRKRAIDGQGCPYCARKKVAPSGWNSLATEFPSLVREWDDSKNPGTALKTLSGAHKSVFWKCSFGHEFRASVQSRTRLGTGCPHCSYQVSKPTKRLFIELTKAFPSLTISIEKRLGLYKFDLAIPNLRVAIEYDGFRFHKQVLQQKRDCKKTAAIKGFGFSLIRVREFGLEIDPEAHCVMLPSRSRGLVKGDIDRVVSAVLTFVTENKVKADAEFYLECSTFQDEAGYQLIARKKRIAQETLADRHPELAREWSDRNADHPSDVTPASHEKRWWVCRTCDRTWQAVVGSRARGHGCPFCSGKSPTEANNLAILFPAVAARLHPNKNNGKTGTEFTPTSNQKVWWKCQKGHEWLAAINNQIKAKVGCERCLGKIATEARSLQTEYPHVASLLNVQRSGKRASEIAPQSGKAYWWICSHGHEWERRVDHQTRGSGGCPECRKKGLIMSWFQNFK